MLDINKVYKTELSKVMSACFQAVSYSCLMAAALFRFALLFKAFMKPH